MITEELLNELREIEAEHGALTPSHVVARARQPQTALHRHFEWDDSTAADRYRLVQADRLIRKVWVHVVPRSNEESAPRRIRASVLPSPSSSEREERLPSTKHRAEDWVEVGVDPVGATELLKSALGELAGIRRKYAHIDALKPVFVELDRIITTAIEPDVHRLMRATEFSRELMRRDGLDIHSAAERGAAVMNVERVAVLGALRMRYAC